MAISKELSQLASLTTVTGTTTTIAGTLLATNISGTNTGDQVLPTLSSLGAQATLVSGTSIKTINGSTLLGSGDIAITSSPAGSTTQVQYNNAGVFAGSANMTFDGTTLTLVKDLKVNGLNVGKGNGTTATNLFIGDTALNASSSITGNYNVGIGQGTMTYRTSGAANVAIGYGAFGTGDGNCNYNIAIGYTALANAGGGQVTGSVAIGYRALYYSQMGYNVAIGQDSLLLNTTGGYNLGIGLQSLLSNTTGMRNIAIGGYNCLVSNTTGRQNLGIGYLALNANTTGRYNTAIGDNSLNVNTTGYGNTAISVTTNAGNYSPVFNPTVEDNRFCMGSTSVTNAYIQVAWTVVSDARDKTDFAPVPHGLDFVSKLKTTAYRYKANRSDIKGHGPLRYGFKAQQVLELEGDTPVIVDAEDLEKLRFNDQAMIAVLVNALQELNAKFDTYVATHL